MLKLSRLFEMFKLNHGNDLFHLLLVFSGHWTAKRLFVLSLFKEVIDMLTQ